MKSRDRWNLTWSSREADGRMLAAATLFARASLGLTFLSAVADRFGWWGPLGTINVAWGGVDEFTAYVRRLTPYLTPTLTEVAAWGSTAIEVVLGVALVIGLGLRWTALASTATLLVFALSMALFAGLEAPLNASVFTAAAAALLLASTPPRSWVLSLDALRLHRSDRRAERQ